MQTSAQDSRIGRLWVVTAGIVAIAIAAASLDTQGTNRPLLAVDSAAGVALVIAAVAVGRGERLGGWLLIFPLGCDLILAGLRQAQGGSVSGYSPLAILPVVWVGLTMGRRSVAVMTAATAAMFALPIVVIGAPLYPSTGWRGVVLWTVVAAVVGIGARRVIAAQRQQTALAAARAVDLDRLVATHSAIATTRFDLDGVLATVAEQALDLTAADAGVVEIPDGEEMVYRAAAGSAQVHLGMRLPRGGSLSGAALEAGDVLYSRDCRTDDRVDREACERVGARSMVVVPLQHDGLAAGVLKVYSSRVDAFDDRRVRVLEGLASVIAAALVRAELLDQLGEQAMTDELTGVMSRREWQRQLELALARVRRSSQPLSVIVIDVDGLKRLNDEEGHAAGDALLCRVSTRWSSALRETDYLGRLGGDEFAVVLEGSAEPDAAVVLERLLGVLGTDDSASAGSATWDGAEDGQSLTARADAAMYVEKKRGRRGAIRPVLRLADERLAS
jgi:diguanylate cyclase (GGDEF)-like protein